MTKDQSTPSESVDLVSRLRVADGTGVVHIEGRLEAPITAVWAALTEPARLAHWLGTFTGDVRRGGTCHARFFASESVGTVQIEVCTPPQQLRVAMTETDATERHVIDVMLRATGDQTVLVVEERGMPPEQLAAYGAGVQIHVEDLAAYLRGGARCDGPARWNALFPSYAAKTIDPA